MELNGIKLQGTGLRIQVAITWVKTQILSASPEAPCLPTFPSQPLLRLEVLCPDWDSPAPGFLDSPYQFRTRMLVVSFAYPNSYRLCASITNDVEHLLCVGHLKIFSGEISVQTFNPF